MGVMGISQGLCRRHSLRAGSFSAFFLLSAQFSHSSPVDLGLQDPSASCGRTFQLISLVLCLYILSHAPFVRRQSVRFVKFSDSLFFLDLSTYVRLS